MKEYEQAKKDEKAQEIRTYFDGIEGKPEWLEIGQIWDSKWLNASKSMKSIRDEIDAALAGIQKDLASLSEIADFGFEATEVYKTTLDINKALAEGMRLSEIQKRKEAEAVRKAELEAQQQEERRIAEEERAAQAWQEPQPVMAAEPQQMEFPQWVPFRALITTEQGARLAAFCKENGIRIERI